MKNPLLKPPHIVLELTVVLIACIGLSFNSTTKQEENVAIALTSMSQDGSKSNSKWMNAINNKDLDALASLYTQDVYGLSTNGVEFSSRDSLISIVEKNTFVVKDVRTISRVAANNKFDYEIGSFKNANDQLMKYVAIWVTSQNTERRTLEFIAETDGNKVDLIEIDAQRAEWIRLCNAHNAKNLINKVYTKNTMYYNHRPMVVGRENLIPLYSYMNNPNYELTLHPISVEAVSETLVLEIGQCKGSYGGKYILIWQKTTEGWQVLFDANL